MDSQAPPFDWNQVRAFLATAETGSFSAAARQLRLTQPTVGRQVSALERALELVLFERVGRRLVLTPAARDLLPHIRSMGEAANRAALTASGRVQTVAGDVCISVTDIFAAYVMPQFVSHLARLAPQVRIRIVVSDQLSDLQRREADIAVRHVAPTQPELIARKLREAGGKLYGSRAFVDRHGPFETVADIANVPFVGIGDARELVSFMRQWGVPVTGANIHVHSNSSLAGWEMARHGLGLTAMIDDMEHLFPDMVPVLPDLEPVRVPYWLTTHRELHSSRRIRLVYDQLAALLSRPRLPDRDL